MHKVKTRENQEYDVWDTTADQAFSIAKRHPRTDDAICATVGQILTYNGKILDTCVYCASNGGQVRSSKEVWGGHRPYLIARSDMFDKRAGKAKNGHGVGMSQWGACQMAVEGRDYEAILGFYYPGAHIVNLSELT